METYELYPLVRQIIREELAQIMMGKVTETTPAFRGTAQRFSSEPPIDNMRLIQPYGLASRPKKGTESVVCPINSDPTHLIILGQNDAARPALEEGESCLYGPDGQIVFMKSGGTIHQGSKAAASPVVLGDVLAQALAELYAKLESALGAMASGPIAIASAPGQLCPTAPGLALALTEAKDALAAQREAYVVDASTNVLGQKNFVERGV